MGGGFTNPYGAPSSAAPPGTEQQPRAYGKGAGGLQALAALWGGVRNVYIMRQQKQIDGLYSQVEIAKMHITYAKQAIEDAKTQGRILDDNSPETRAYADARARGEEAFNNLQKATQGKPEKGTDPGMKGKAENAWKLIQRIALGPKIQTPTLHGAPWDTAPPGGPQTPPGVVKTFPEQVPPSGGAGGGFKPPPTGPSMPSTQNIFSSFPQAMGQEGPNLKPGDPFTDPKDGKQYIVRSIDSDGTVHADPVNSAPPSSAPPQGVPARATGSW
jgi:hypothetical protein